MRAGLFVDAIPHWRAEDQTLSGGLEQAISNAILDGRIAQGMRLPSERSLADALDLSRVTVSAAYAGLRAHGWIETVRGAGSRARLPRRLDAQIDPGPPAVEGEIDLARASPVAPLPAYLAALGRATEQLSRYALSPMPTAPPELRERIAARYTYEGLRTRPDQILVTAGAGAALTLLTRHLVSPGARALVESPTYLGALALLRSARLRLVGWPVSKGWDAELFETVVRDAHPTLAYLVPDFHNPTGALASEQERRALVGIARTANLTLVIDETMRDLDLRGGNPDPPAQMPDEPWIVRVGSLAKTVWGGLSVGWMRGPRGLVAEITAGAESAYLAPPILSQLVALELLPSLDRLIAARRAQLKIQLAALRESLEQIPAAELTQDPAGGLTAWAELTSGASSAEMARRAPEHGLRLLPGGSLTPDGTLDRFLRLPFTLAPGQLRAGIARLPALLAEPPQRRSGR
jgi:DNA-binding transcriptional MocR family regulator